MGKEMTVSVKCSDCEAVYLLDEEDSVPPGTFLECAECGASWRLPRFDTPFLSVVDERSSPLGTSVETIVDSDEELPPILRDSSEVVRFDAMPNVDGELAQPTSGADSGTTIAGSSDLPVLTKNNASARELAELGEYGGGAYAETAVRTVVLHGETSSEVADEGEGVAANLNSDAGELSLFGRIRTFLRLPSKGRSSSQAVIVKCTGCGKRYRVGKQDAWSQGRMVECSSCGLQWWTSFASS